MDYILFNATTHRTFSFCCQFPLTSHNKPRQLLVVSRAGSSHCEPSSSSSSSSLNTPLEPKSAAGRFLSGVFQNQRPLFHVAVAEELRVLAEDRDTALSRMSLSSRSDDAFLHSRNNDIIGLPDGEPLSTEGMRKWQNRDTLLAKIVRIAQLKEQECQIAVEDVMYMLIFSKFSEIRVPLVPKLSRCIYNGRLEILPSKDWELESIHNFEVLEMIKEHVSTVIGLRINSSVTDNWAITKIKTLQLGRVYAASILYGYFLKYATSRYNLERYLHVSHRNTHQFSESASNLVFGHMSIFESASVSNREEFKQDSLRSYVMGFDAETLQRCAKPKSKEAANLIEKHSCALFGCAKTGLLENDDLVTTSFSTMKRLVLEAVAFGSFLWDIEEYVNSMFKLREN